MIPSKPVDLTLDCLLWVSGTAFGFSFVSHLLRVPQTAFVFGALSACGVLALMAVSQRVPVLRTAIAYRLGQVVFGVVVGILG